MCSKIKHWLKFVDKLEQLPKEYPVRLMPIPQVAAKGSKALWSTANIYLFKNQQT